MMMMQLMTMKDTSFTNMLPNSIVDETSHETTLDRNEKGVSSLSGTLAF
jgi:hypothetical protein